jgi:hypothetical protein
VPVAVTLKLAVCPAVTVLFAGWEVIDGALAAGFTVTVRVAVPVDPPYPAEIDAPYMVTVVEVVTVGAFQLNVQLRGVELSEASWVISPFITCVLDPAVKVPALAATSNPLLGVPLLVRV